MMFVIDGKGRGIAYMGVALGVFLYDRWRGQLLQWMLLFVFSGLATQLLTEVFSTGFLTPLEETDTCFKLEVNISLPSYTRIEIRTLHYTQPVTAQIRSVVFNLRIWLTL